MNREELTFARLQFKSKINSSDGNAFEKLFSLIMGYYEPDFIQVKPQGIIGDRKNDGYIGSKGIYFQVFAPEDIRKSYSSAVKKIKDDFDGLKSYWTPINEFFFVVNDKYYGVYPESITILNKIKVENNLNKTGFLTAKDLENMTFELNDSQIQAIVGFLPDPGNIKQLDFGILNEIIGHIMSLAIELADPEIVVLPDWDSKIVFNDLSSFTATRLNNGYISVPSLEDYLRNEGNFLADDLRNKMNQIYKTKQLEFTGDELFIEIMNEACPIKEQQYQNAVIVIMAKYFESCDIFENPPLEF
jgi:C-terminal domain 10 of the ABC-three component (ABC-3C) systems